MIKRVESGHFVTNRAIEREYERALAKIGRGVEGASGARSLEGASSPFAMGAPPQTTPAAALGGFRGSQQQTEPLLVRITDEKKPIQWWRVAMWGAVGLYLYNTFYPIGSGESPMDDSGNEAQPGGTLRKALGFTNAPSPTQIDTDVTFEDVKGVDEAKEELEEVVQFLKRPQDFTKLGGKLPAGVMLMGPPGTGKTLLAKAIAGEAGVPFFYASGSEFDEIFVGLGAKRVRELFAAARKKAPCIVFIDEIDAFGGKRGGRDVSNTRATLNQFLTELDGFKGSEGVVVIGATNVADSLDAALVRPGRFDKMVNVGIPDIKGRTQILELYLGKSPTADDVDVDRLARATTGMTGADLANLVNTAALRASVQKLDAITMSMLEYAREKIQMGAERRSAVIPKSVLENTAYHEGGHALVALLTKGALPLNKMTIMPRGRALGYVSQLPEEKDMVQRTKAQLLAEIDVCMGGRVAEMLVFGGENVTSGASSDLAHATKVATDMVTQYGMGSESVGYATVRDNNVSFERKEQIDAEVKSILDASMARVTRVLTEKKAELELLAKTLLEKESMTADEIKQTLNLGG